MLLTAVEIESKLKNLHVEWAVISGAQLQRSYSFEDFKSALEHVNKVGVIAEELNHHPDIQLSYGKVEVIISSHEQGGLTDKDFELARKIDQDL
jgi:4a-hydroxytetrahydrobiopterin dehydratase